MTKLARCEVGQSLKDKKDTYLSFYHLGDCNLKTYGVYDLKERLSDARIELNEHDRDCEPCRKAKKEEWTERRNKYRFARKNDKNCAQSQTATK